MRLRLLVSLVVLALAACARGHATSPHHQHDVAVAAPAIGFVVAAPDRGFLGNEEVADAVAELPGADHTRVVYVTDERTGADLGAAIDALAATGAQRVVVLPLFVSRGEARFAELERAMAGGTWKVPVELGGLFGDSYLAVELIADRLRSIEDVAGKRLVVVGYGATDDASRDRIGADLHRVAAAAAEGFGLSGVEVIVWRDRDQLPRGTRDTAAAEALRGAVGEGGAVVVPIELGPKLDSMMTFRNELAMLLPERAIVAAADVTPDPLVGLWMAREASLQTPLRDDEIGVVMLAHGSDHHWNQTMRDALATLAKRYDIEFAFSMADQPIVERAIRRLERRGKRGIVVVRVFGLESSFRATVEDMLGIGHGHVHGHGHGHGHGHAPATPPPRIRSASQFATVGGLEDSAEFADALVDRARALSRDPARETVVLVAHGSGDDTTNDHWRDVLGALADRMRAAPGPAFRAIEVGTWREDWPDKRAPELAAIRAIVERAARDGGRALVIPARTTAEGSEDVFLEGLTYELGSGFAPHPLFTAWFERQVQAGIAALRGAVTPTPPHAHH